MPHTSTRTLVTGGRGRTGREVVRLLTASDVQVIAGTRTPRPRHEFVNPVRFDWQDPRTWTEAVAGVDSIFLMRPDVEDAPQLVRDLVARAPSAHIVLLSEQGAGALADSSWERRVELAVTEHAASWTLLRPSWFHQVMEDPRFYLAAIRDRRVLPIASGGAKLAFVDARDIAAVAVAALKDRTLDAEAVTITGPESLSIIEAAQILSSASGAVVRAVDPSRNELAAGLDPWLAETVGKMVDRVRAGAFSETTDDVLRITGHHPRGLEAFASERPEIWHPAAL